MPKSARRRASKDQSRDELKQIIRDAFRQRFPHDTVDVSDGYEDNIHVLVVSREFDKMREKQKQDVMWKIIDSTPLTDDQKALISLVFPVSPAEIK
ncbi:MAG TPA: hypothetical protein VIM11_25285 [Tepidisphaeraceae bacterium]|jgi:acid stress-induced BolA-like protein IbaG/YrbA